MDKWDARFMSLADLARTWVKTEIAEYGVGACLVHPNRRRLSLGYSGFARTVPDDPGLDKDLWYMHAEENAILNAACSVESWTMYVTWPPCTLCASRILQAEIGRVVYRDHPAMSDRWRRNTGLALDMLERRMPVCRMDALQEGADGDTA